MVTLALRSIALNVPSSRRVKGIFDTEVLYNLVALCDRFPLGFVYKPMFLLAVFAFFRVYNLVPPSISSFSPLVHLCRGDFIPHPPFATIVVKWSKTLQKQSQFATVQVPSLGASPLCPLAAIASMTSSIPLPPNAPMFAIHQGPGVIPLTESKVRKTLSSLLSSLNIDPSTHSFHTFRRSGSSLAFDPSNNMASGLLMQCGLT